MIFYPYYFFSDETQQNIENNKKNSNCYEEEFLPALGRVKPTYRRSSVTSLVHTLQSIQIDTPPNNKVSFIFIFHILYIVIILKLNTVCSMLNRMF